MNGIYCSADLWATLRSVITNLPERDVERAVITVTGDDVPRVELTMFMRDASGEMVVSDDSNIDEAAPLGEGMKRFRMGTIARTVKRFKLVPEEA